MWYWCTGLSVGLSLLRLVFVRPPCPVRGGVMSKFWGLRMVLFVGWWVYVLLRWLLGGMNLIFLAQEYGGIITPVVIGILIKGQGWEYHDPAASILSWVRQMVSTCWAALNHFNGVEVHSSIYAQQRFFVLNVSLVVFTKIVSRQAMTTKNTGSAYLLCTLSNRSQNEMALQSCNAALYRKGTGWLAISLVWMALMRKHRKARFVQMVQLVSGWMSTLPFTAVSTLAKFSLYSPSSSSASLMVARDWEFLVLAWGGTRARTLKLSLSHPLTSILILW